MASASASAVAAAVAAAAADDDDDCKPKAICYTNANGVAELRILDQVQLPHISVYMNIGDVEDAWRAIRNMQVRGAPAIAIVALLAVAVELITFHDKFGKTSSSMTSLLRTHLDYLKTSRPTAVNLSKEADRLFALAEDNLSLDVDALRILLVSHCEDMLIKDVEDNRNIGRYGSAAIRNTKRNIGVDKLSILTHCNTGSLATAGYGTALGVIRSLHEGGSLKHAYCTETRPYNQGARLTAYELVYENIPATLITDSMAAALMKSQQLGGIVVGADRVAANGDTANKIGTYQLAIIASYHSVPFFVAAPSTSIDLSLDSGDEIEIELRPGDEMLHIGGIRVAAPKIGTWNPGFDVTPASLITAIVTEVGIIYPGKDKTFDMTGFLAAHGGRS